MFIKERGVFKVEVWNAVETLAFLYSRCQYAIHDAQMWEDLAGVEVQISGPYRDDNIFTEGEIVA